MEQDAKDATGIARSQHKLFTLPHDRGAVGQFLSSPLERVEPSADDTQVLVLTADTDATSMISGVATQLGAERGVRVVPVTSAKRGARLVKERGAHVVVGTPEEILPLIQASTLKLAGLRTIVLAWIDETTGADSTPALEAIMSEIPKDAARSMVVGHLGADAQQLAERYVRRGLRSTEKPAEEEGTPVSMQYLTVSGAGRSAALRRLLDELDPARAAVWVRTEESAHEAQRTLSELGYRASDDSVRVVHGGALGDAGLVILYEVPANGAELRSTLATAAAVPQVVVLSQPRQMALLRSIAGGAAVTPLTLTGPASEARRREDSVRSELRAALESGLAARELLSLEPLLAEFDGIAIAAAALRLLEQERSKKGKRPKSSATDELDVTAVFPPLAAPSGRSSGARPQRAEPGAFGVAGTRLFLTVGERDGIKPGDLVGAIAATAGISGENIGKIELRDTHALVEIVGVDAGAVAEKITGANIKGRRVVARLERDRPPRDDAPRGGGGRERPGGARGAGDRPRFGGGDRPRSGTDRPRPPRGEWKDRGDKPHRDGSDRPRSDRPPRSAGDRPGGERPRFDRGDRPSGGERGPKRRPEGRGQG